MEPDDFPGTVEQSREVLLEAIGTAPDLTFVRGLGNRGDELIWAGTRELLRDHVVREIGVEEIGTAGGEVALLSGGGAWSRRYHEYMPPLLAVAERRFDRVVVLPSSYDTGEDRVAEALRASSATFFAREAESYRRIAGLCRAVAAHDCAFFFDFSPHRATGDGSLDAFREDAEAPPGEPPADNLDISVACESLDEWLAAIARAAEVRTDRAHVMLAAALMGKAVEVGPSVYGKLEALRETLPPDARERVEVRQGARGGAGDHARPQARGSRQPAKSALVTAFILTRDRPDRAAAAVGSVLESDVGARVQLLDNNSAPSAHEQLEALAAAEPAVDLRRSDRNLGTAGGRSLAAELVTTEFTLFLDDDAELMPGALEQLTADLAGHPEADGVTALVTRPDGRVQHFGGWPEVSRELATFPLEGCGATPDDPALPPTGPSGWLPGTAALVRTELLREIPVDPGMAAYYEDNEWSLRVTRRRPRAFRRCREAVVAHRSEGGPPTGTGLVERWRAAERLAAHAWFLRCHGLVLCTDLAEMVPELRAPGGGVDVAAARLLLTLLDARGPGWLVSEWLGEGLAPLLFDRRGAVAREAELEAEVERLTAELEPLRERHATLAAVEEGGWWRLRGQLQPILRPAARVRDRAARVRGRLP